MRVTVDPRDVWLKQATQWSRVGAPLRPVHADLDPHRELAKRFGRPRVLVLGVTPELATLGWPDGTELLAVDRSDAMIGGVWPGFPAPGQGALLADWRTMVLPPASRDLVVGDGVLNVLAPDDARDVLSRLRDVVTPAGQAIVRTFVQPDAREDAVHVHADARAGGVRSFHAYKLRLLMATQARLRDGARLGDVWAACDLDAQARATLSEATGWSLDTIATLDAYRDQDTRLYFPRRDELTACVEAAGWRVDAEHRISEELGERCPTWVLSARR